MAKESYNTGVIIDRHFMKDGKGELQMGFCPGKFDITTEAGEIITGTIGNVLPMGMTVSFDKDDPLEYYTLDTEAFLTACLDIRRRRRADE